MILPEPGEDFEWRQTGSGPALVCRSLERDARHLFTTRSWRLGTPATGDDVDAWAEVARALDVDEGGLLRVEQVHGPNVVVQRAGCQRGARARGDVLLSNDSTVAIAVQSADCVPMLLADSRTGSIAAAHAGWRGLALAVPVRTVTALVRDLDSRPPDLIAAIGPSIGACCYQVGSDVRETFQAAGFSEATLGRWFSIAPHRSARNPSMPAEPREGSWFLDLQAATADQLASAGVPRRQIHVAGLCTASHAGAFCSYRRDGARTGRLAAAIRKYHS
jgi:hypothetical protein